MKELRKSGTLTVFFIIHHPSSQKQRKRKKLYRNLASLLKVKSALSMVIVKSSR